MALRSSCGLAFSTCLDLIIVLVFVGCCFADAQPASTGTQRLLYVGTPGIRDYLDYGGHGVLVFDIDHGHRFVRRIPFGGCDEKGKPLNVKGIAANAATKRLYITTTRTLTCMDLLTEKVMWEKPYAGGCDRLALGPEGKIIYLPSLEQAHWHVLNALTGEIIKRLEPGSGAHNTIYGLEGKHAYLAGLKSPLLRVTETGAHTVTHEVGPFGDVIRPFTVNGRGTLCFVNVNELLGFEMGDLLSGKLLYRVEVRGFQKGPTKRHGCPSHGIGLTPNEKELWLCDSYNRRLHIFDATATPPKQTESIQLRDEPGWITFGIDGQFAYPSTGEVVETASRTIVATLKDEQGAEVESEKLLEVDFERGQPVRVGDQFGLGRIQSH
jgi:hypothetical protein